MTERQAVQLLTIEQLPPGYVLVHQRDEPGVTFTRLPGQDSIDAEHRIAHNKEMDIGIQTIITGSLNFTKSAET